MNTKLNDIFKNFRNKIEKLSHEEQRQSHREGNREGYDEGHEEGTDEGQREGYDKGYDEGWDRGVKFYKSDIMAQVNSIEYLVRKIQSSPWLMDKAVDIFDIAGYSLKKNTIKTTLYMVSSR
jgi:flagellar biosynthesis/type III secretory pathway protein FliH